HETTAPLRSRGRGRTLVWGAAAAALVIAAAAAVFFVVRGGDDGVPAAFTVPMDVCSLLTPEDAGRLLRTQRPPKGQPGSDEVGPTCQWPMRGNGVSLQLQKDSDTPDPWSMTPSSARTLFANQKRYWARFGGAEIDWTWPEIGAGGSLKATLTPVRDIGGVGQEAFAHELKGATGRMHSAYVYYRLANLVVRVEYTTLASRPSDEDIKRNALAAARAIEQALRRAG
uniref:hypothetical protein n=1 Tax=Nonomuraea lactucae TaxID=2249762 RepID=UPI0013B43F0A